MSAWANKESVDKARTRFRDLVWTACERLWPEDGTVTYHESEGGSTASVIWGADRQSQVDVTIKYEGSNGWRAIFGRTFGAGLQRRLKAPKLDTLTVDVFVMELVAAIERVKKVAGVEARERADRLKSQDALKALKVRAAEALGFPLDVAPTYYNRIQLDPTEWSSGEITFNIDVRWRKLSMEQVIAIKEILAPKEETPLDAAQVRKLFEAKDTVSFDAETSA